MPESVQSMPQGRNGMKLEVMVVCPAHVATGGTEALHGFVHELNKVKGVHARLWYWNVHSDDPCPEAFRGYACDHVIDLPYDFDGALVVPEIWANSVMQYDCIRAIYWLGVDAYAGWTPDVERGKFLEDKSIIHIVQSEYAWDVLSKLRVKHIVKCTDTVNADFYDDYDEAERSDAVLYNPAKSTPFMKQLMDECADIEFKPIAGMDRQQVIDTMRRSKLYIDFGEFPGRERIPREAALCGCCLITGKIGSAGYDGDFLHAYKFDSKQSLIWAIKHQIRYVLEHYDECRKDFDAFRESLRVDADVVSMEIKEVVDEIQRHYSRVQQRGVHKKST